MTPDRTPDSASEMVVRLTDATRSCLMEIDGATVTVVSTPGAMVEDVRDGVMFRVPGLVVRTDRDYLIAAEAVDVGDRDEVFRIVAVPFDATRHQSRPAYAPIGGRPRDLNLGGLIGSPTRINVARSDVLVTGLGAPIHALVDASVLLRTQRGPQLLVDARCDDFSDAAVPVMPLDLVLAVDPAAIDARLARSQVTSLAHG